jgi:O-antigen ligase
MAGGPVTNRPRHYWKVLFATVLIVGTFLAQIVVAPTGKDAYRLPKELVLRAEALLLVAIFAGWATWRPSEIRFDHLRHPTVALGTATFMWIVISAQASINPTLSGAALLDAAVIFVIAIGAYLGAAFLDQRALAAVLVPAAGISIMAVAERLRDAPLTAEWPYKVTTVLGNPNFVGGHLCVPTILAVCWYQADKNKRWLALAGLLGAGVVASGSIAAIVTLFIGTCVVFARHRVLRVATVVATALVVIVVATISAHDPTRERISGVVERLTDRKLDAALSGRILPAVVAIKMFSRKPILGSGPGTFHFEYMPYVVELARVQAPVVREAHAMSINFGEAHNEHLQILAEVGLPGYLLFLSLLAVLGGATFEERHPTDLKDHLVRTFSLPFAVTVAVMCVAQFPLHLAATVATYAYLAGIFAGWARRPAI